MKKRVLSFICAIVMIVSVSLTVIAETTHINSDIYFSAGGSGYSDSLPNPTYYHVSEANTRYNNYYVKLTSFRFDGYAQGYKPDSSVRFNFRLVKKAEHTSIGYVIHLYNTNSSDVAETYAYHAATGESVAIKSNTSYYESAGCGLSCEWYLYLPAPVII